MRQASQQWGHSQSIHCVSSLLSYISKYVFGCWHDMRCQRPWVIVMRDQASQKLQIESLIPLWLNPKVATIWTVGPVQIISHGVFVAPWDKLHQFWKVTKEVPYSKQIRKPYAFANGGKRSFTERRWLSGIISGRNIRFSNECRAIWFKFNLIGVASVRAGMASIVWKFDIDTFEKRKGPATGCRFSINNSQEGGQWTVHF